jgi:hypothetical protein
MRRATKHSSKFVSPQTRLPQTITLSALDGSNKHQQFIETLAKIHTQCAHCHLHIMVQGVSGDYNNKHGSSIIYEE